MSGPAEEARRSNRALWDRWTEINTASDFYDLDSFKADPERVTIGRDQRDEVGDVAGRSLLHVQCHFGLDSLSWARLGANVTGVDFSPKAIAAARSLATEIGIAAIFVESDVYDLRDALEGQFDIVYTSTGVLGWLPDIEDWARVVAHFVRPGGFLYLTEIHPVALVFEDEGVEPGELRLAYPYWSHEDPHVIPVQGSYADREAALPGFVEHVWNHSLGEIVTALIKAGLRLEFLHEFDFVRWSLDFLVRSEDGRYRLPDGSNGDLPLFFSLKASKPPVEAARPR